MQLSDEERFALLYTLSEQSVILEALLDNILVSERKNTGVGFFTTAILSKPFSVGSPAKRYWERNFEHKKMPYGGCFMVSQIEDSILEIEAVAFESTWPEPFIRDEFIH